MINARHYRKVTDMLITKCEDCPNCKGGSWYINFCIATRLHKVIRKDDLKRVPDWCPLPLFGDD